HGGEDVVAAVGQVQARAARKHRARDSQGRIAGEDAAARRVAERRLAARGGERRVLPVRRWGPRGPVGVGGGPGRGRRAGGGGGRGGSGAGRGEPPAGARAGASTPPRLLEDAPR